MLRGGDRILPGVDHVRTRDCVKVVLRGRTPGLEGSVGGDGDGGRALQCRRCGSGDLRGRDGEVRSRRGGGAGGGGGGGGSRLSLRVGGSAGARSRSRSDGDGSILTLLDVDSWKLQAWFEWWMCRCRCTRKVRDRVEIRTP